MLRCNLPREKCGHRPPKTKPTFLSIAKYQKNTGQIYLAEIDRQLVTTYEEELMIEREEQDLRCQRSSDLLSRRSNINDRFRLPFLTSMRSRCLLGERYGGYFEVILRSSVPLQVHSINWVSVQGNLVSL
jgi:hypothetical protein